MNTHMGRIGFAMVLGGSLSFGCQAAQPVQSPADHAGAVERTVCTADFSEAVVSRILDGSAVEHVEPVYTGFVGKSSNPRLAGAAIIVRPVQGETAEWLTRMLECHGAQRLMEQAKGSPVRADPFWLADSLVQIEVTGARNGFRIQVTSGSATDAREILSRAQALPTSTQTAVFDAR